MSSVAPQIPDAASGDTADGLPPQWARAAAEKLIGHAEWIESLAEPEPPEDRHAAFLYALHRHHAAELRERARVLLDHREPQTRRR